jgi:hypothetical protein
MSERDETTSVQVDAQSFQAALVRPAGVGTWTYLVVPLDLAALYGAKGQIKVRGTINGLPFRSSAMPRGDGAHYLVVNKTLRDQIGATQGDTVTVTLERDTEMREITVPDDFQHALDADDAANVTFTGFSPSRRKLYVEWIEAAKSAETRQRRIQSAVARIAQGMPLK